MSVHHRTESIYKHTASAVHAAVQWVFVCFVTAVTATPCFLVQVQNASDLLIKPLEKFRKEQIGVTKVSRFTPYVCSLKRNGAQSCEQLVYV